MTDAAAFEVGGHKIKYLSCILILIGIYSFGSGRLVVDEWFFFSRKISIPESKFRKTVVAKINISLHFNSERLKVS